MELKDARRSALKRLGDEPSYKIDAIFEELFGITRKDLIVEGDRMLSEAEMEALDSVIEEVERKKPLAYIFHRAYFMGEPFYVDERVLIPRYDTEQSIDAIEALELKEPKILEIGTGSGCVAITLSKRLKGSRVVACDVSKEALEVAAINKKRHGADRVDLVESDLFSAIEGRFDLIYSNPPYISKGEMQTLDESVSSYEPHLALYGGEEGLDFYRAIIREAQRHLYPGGYLVFEIGSGQGSAVSRLMTEGYFSGVEVRKDFSGLDRVVVGRLTNV
ncbi:MAG: peptide chain release factor N(5)-glutamine methyltransferase [Peptoniphilus sp.]|nr:peptide chain release factor N(5)-glutamine methyltransferase [Peptoniphilus sp.]MDD7363326.1 peptide chain release factor N(5)-glutamine methyltransferase [Bacillota bacterium]MDY6044245.1 peptide chain release factor N(5)-glutamine methyltransferase [Peptoniphilus sp.]